MLCVMHYRRLGRTELMVSEVGFGGLPIGGLRWGDVRDEESLAALRRAYDLGTNFFDTADVYGRGHSEELIGQALGEVRSHVLIATKAGIDFYHGEPARNRFEPSYIRSAIERGVERLRTDYIDLFQLHNPPEKLARDSAIWEELSAAQREGRIRYFGVSCRTANDARAYIRAAEGAEDPRAFGDTLQVAYNLLDQEAAEKDVFVEAHRQGWGIISRVPLASGLLSGRYGATHKFPPNDFRADWSAESLSEASRRIEELRFLEVPGRTLAQAAIAFCLSQPAVSTVITGAKTPGQVEENTVASELAPLSHEELARIRSLG
jgi:aryl-alcohol dehydrogenase-like predicted oxidoreductase